MFSYVDQRFFADTLSDEEARLRASFASLGEPWVSGFDPAALAEDLREVGFQLVETLGQDELRERYCAGRAEGLQPSVGENVARARVGS